MMTNTLNFRPYALTAIGLGAAVAGFVWFMAPTTGEDQDKLALPETYEGARLDVGKAQPYYGEKPVEKKPVEDTPAAEKRPTERRPTERALAQYQAPRARQKPADMPSLAWGEVVQAVAIPASTGLQTARAGEPSSELPSQYQQGLSQQKREFLARRSGSSHVTAPYIPQLSPTFIRSGTLVQTTVLNGATTNQPGGLVAQVNYDVMDSLKGTCVLIPASSYVIWEINDLVTYGDDRMQAASQRIEFPDGAIQEIPGMAATDETGKAGLKGRVDRHHDTMAMAIIGDATLKVLGSAGRLFGGGSGDVNIGVMSADALGGSVSDVGNEIVRRELDRQNEITLEPGDPMSLFVQRQLILPPYGECNE